MFPRAPRFTAARQSDTPGPNAYDPTEMVAHYKRGILVQRDARFKTAASSNEGSSTSSASSSIPARAMGGTVDSAAALKEKSKWAARVSEAEERVVDLERHANSLANEKSQAMAELRECRCDLRVCSGRGLTVCALQDWLNSSSKDYRHR